MRVLEPIGAVVYSVLEETGRIFLLLVETIVWAVRPPYDVQELLRQMVQVGVSSFPVVALTAVFTGMVIGLETYSGFQLFRAEAFTGGVVALSLLREVVPVFTALMVNGRVGSAIAAELGSMRATEQIDALVAMGDNPVQYLFVPRIIAGVTMLPFLGVLGNGVSVLGGRLMAVTILGANPAEYDKSTFRLLDPIDFNAGLLKAVVFGLLFTLISCSMGFQSSGGAEGVGRSTTRAVVTSSAAIVIADLFITRLLF